ncbi:VOC family protein [Sphingomonas koreensis]
MTPPFAMRGIDHIVLRVVDLPRMLAFYHDVLGCTDERERAEFGLYQLRAGASLIDLVTLEGKLGARGGAAPGTEGRNLDHFALAIDPFDRDALGTHLAAHDVDILEEGPRYGAEGEGPSIYIRDPEGNVIELKGSLS